MIFYWTPASFAVSAVTLLIAAICCWISWRRSGCARTMGVLEVFRFGLITLVLFTLNQPEVIENIRPDDQPVLAVLHDISGSMQTRDVADSGASATRQEPMTRAAAAAPYTQESFWAPLTNQLDVIIEPFSSQLSDAAAATDINGALQSLSDRHLGLRAVVLLSDGDWNIGNAPHTAATDLRMKSIPVWSVAVGAEDRLPDMELVSSSAPTIGLVNKVVRIPFRIRNWLPQDQSVVVTLKGADGKPNDKTVRVDGMGQLNDTIEWRPEQTGKYALTLSIPVCDEEAVTNNNHVSIPISIRNEALRVLIVESWPRWEYRYLRNALERDPGVEVHCQLFHPNLQDVGGGRGYLEHFPSEKDLFKYDVIFLGDVGVQQNQLSFQDCENIRQLVRSHAGGLVFLPGFRGYQQSLLTTELEELYPVVADKSQPRGIGISSPARFALTESGRRSLLTHLEPDDDQNEQVWQTLPGFQWYAATLRARIGTDVLVTHDSATTRFGRVPLIATRTARTGKVLFMGTDGAWRWRKGIEDLYHYRFWGQVVRWMAYQRNISTGEFMRLFYAPDRPKADNVLTLNANVMNTTGEPLTEGTVAVQIVTPSGRTDSVRLAPSGDDSWGLFTGTFTPTEGGQYHLVTTCADTGARLETTIAVQGQEREQVGQPARFDVLREISQVSRGALKQISDVETLIDQLAALPEPDLITRRFRIWSNPLWGALLVLLLGGFWSARKFAGLV